MIWRVGIVAPDGEHLGFEYFAHTHPAMDRIEALEAEGFTVEASRLPKIPTDTKALVELLNKWAAHPDNG